MKFKFYPLDITYKVIEGAAVIFLFGTTTDGKKVCIADAEFKPYFYVVPKKGDISDKLLKIKVDVKEEAAKVTEVLTVKKKYLGKEVSALKVYTQLPRDVPIIRDVIKDWDMIKLITEYDILFVRRYLIDKEIVPLTLTTVECEEADYGLKVPTFNAKKMSQEPDETLKEPRILAFDLETYNPHGQGIAPEKNPILMVSFYGKDIKKVVTWKHFKTDLDYVEFVDGEVDLIEKFKEVIEKYKPDIICGYYSDGFDFPYINSRAKKYKIKLDLGLDGSELVVNNRGKVEKASITGIVHIDVFRFIRKILRVNLDTDRFGLNEVAFELLGEKKKDVELDNLAKVWDSSPEKLGEFCEYNLHDSYLTYRILESSFANIIEMVKIVGLPPFDLIRLGFSQLVEWYLLRQAPRYNELAPQSPTSEQIKQRRLVTYKGGFVYEPKPGLYKEIVVYDFRSLYPSIISSHNISPASFNAEGIGEQVPLEDEFYWFDTERGFIPDLIEDIIKRRMRIKEIMKGEENPFLEARSQSLKILANSFYGYLGFYGARWYSMECARSTTAYGRHYITTVIEKAKDNGFEVLYADTDSCFLALGSHKKADADNFVDEINKTLPGVMELEFDGYYKRGIFVSAKMSAFGAKKKYALLDQDNKLKLRGFEAVRRNTSNIAKQVQEKLLRIVLEEGDKEKALKYVREVLEDIRKKKIKNEDMVITTQLSKETYDYQSVGPHVKIAERMKELGMEAGVGTIIQYIVAGGGGIVRDRAKLPEEVKEGDYDPNYYINNQVVPAVDKIMEVLGYTKDDIIASEGQKKLGGFF
ncbi:MAG: DNA-directed DNA polymerase [Nanoarchaeota archaeon]|nr:DNA-directed DNA polymerase [Nanoarchaeota archaeon]